LGKFAALSSARAAAGARAKPSVVRTAERREIARPDTVKLL
jgi:hypothetical protein